MSDIQVAHVVKLQNGFPFESTDFGSDGPTPLLRIRDLTAPTFETYLPFTVPEQFTVMPGDLVVGMDGDFNAQIWHREPAALNQRVCRLRAVAGNDIRFIAYALPRELQQINDTQYATTVKHLSSAEILKTKIPSWPLEEQRRIADFLDDRVARIDQIIAGRRQQAYALQEGIDAEWAAITERLTAAPWVPMRRFLLSITDGPFGSSLSSKHYADDGTRVIRLGNLGLAQFRDSDHAYIPDGYADQLNAHSVIPGDLIMAGLGDERWPLGRSVVAPDDLGPAIVKADCYRIRLDCRIQHEFAAMVFSSPPSRGRFGLLARGSTRARLNTEVAREALIPHVDLASQRTYIDQVQALQDVGETNKKQLTCAIRLLQEYKQSLITAAVTGELDVTTASSRIPE